jgi:NAD(P)H-dependent flavin oxidoreductase YrpB (nitropropane dioxygenase family)
MLKTRFTEILGIKHPIMLAGMNWITTREGDEKDGFLFAGQCAGGIKDMPNCKERIERIVAEAEKRMEAVARASRVS